MFIVTVLLLVCGTFEEVTSTSGTEQEKQICITEDILRFMIRLQPDKGNRERPAFSALLKTHPFVLNDVDAVVKFDDVRINRGNGYNPSTGYFTAPRKGIYQISCMLKGVNDGTSLAFQLNKNNEAYIYGSVEKDGYHSQTISSIIVMEKNDRVFVKHRSPSVEKVYGNHHSTFSGYFIQE